jgi:ABC-type amino acid transport substrate-binding protein
LIITIGLAAVQASGRDLKDIQQDGVIRHLGVPYANFVSGDGRGLDVELIQLFAKEIGVEYQYVEASWSSVISSLVGRQYTTASNTVTLGDEVPVRGDLIANGLTVLPWRQQLLDFSRPTFPTQVWLVTSAASPLQPISPNGSIEKDIEAVKNQLPLKSVLTVKATCLDPSLYALDKVGAKSIDFKGSLNDLAPAVLKGLADSTLLDVPDSLIALEKWPSQIKIIGPVSATQEMAVAFRKDSPELKQAFAVFLKKIWENGTYAKMVQKYYPDVFDYYPEFFASR